MISPPIEASAVYKKSVSIKLCASITQQLLLITLNTCLLSVSPEGLHNVLYNVYFKLNMRIITWAKEWMHVQFGCSVSILLRAFCYIEECAEENLPHHIIPLSFFCVSLLFSIFITTYCGCAILKVAGSTTQNLQEVYCSWGRTLQCILPVW